MYLIDCVRLASKYYPSEYGEYEKLLWCNEVTAILAEATDGVCIPVRLPKYLGYSKLNGDFFTTDFPVFLVGDTVNISLNNGEYEYNEVPVLDAKYEDGRYVLYTSPGMFDEAESENAEITRCVTDKTYCDAPYDEMYTYYILAKICLLQHDIDMYNQYMNMFNNLFNLYKLSRTGKRTHNIFINFWNRK